MIKLQTVHGKFFSYTALLLTIPPLIFLLFFYSIFRNETLYDAYTNIQNEVLQQQTALNGWIAHHEALLAVVAAGPKLIQQPDSLKVLLQTFLSFHLDFKTIILFDKNGDSKMSFPDRKSVNVSDREYFARARKGLPTVTSPLISRLDGDQIIIVAHPVYDGEDNFGGVIIGAIRFKNFLNEFSLAETNNTSRPYLVEASDKSLLSSQHDTTASIILPPRKDNSSPKSYINSNGERVIGVSAPVNDGKWLVVIERRSSSIMKRMESFLIIFVCTSLASLIILIPFINKYIFTLIRPIKAISSISTELLNDQIKSECPYIEMKNNPVEIVTLYKNFCDMATKLSGYVFELKQHSLTDPLTGLANRRYFETEGFKIIEICRRNGTACSCMLLDLDHFKHVNDTFGHQAGDAALQTVSKIIKRNTRTADICARFGGEEFTILATSTPIDNAAILAERIRTEIENTKITYDDLSFSVTASIGIAQLEMSNDENTKILENGIKKADEAMYKAKTNGRNRVEL